MKGRKLELGLAMRMVFKRASHIGFDCIVFAVSIACICTCEFYQKQTFMRKKGFHAMSQQQTNAGGN